MKQTTRHWFKHLQLERDFHFQAGWARPNPTPCNTPWFENSPRRSAELSWALQISKSSRYSDPSLQVSLWLLPLLQRRASSPKMAEEIQGDTKGLHILQVTFHSSVSQMHFSIFQELQKERWSWSRISRIVSQEARIVDFGDKTVRSSLKTLQDVTRNGCYLFSFVRHLSNECLDWNKMSELIRLVTQPIN